MALRLLHRKRHSYSELHMVENKSRGEGASRRGFASMDPARQKAIASMGGKSVPGEKRSFSQNRILATKAGRKGGLSVAGEKRSFSQDRTLAASAGRKGGQSVPSEKRSFSQDPQLAATAGRKGGQAAHDVSRGASKARSEKDTDPSTT
jgi:uncharacterized protein